MPSLDTEIWILHKFHLSHNIVIIFPLGEFSLFLLLLAIGLHQKNMSPDLICKLCFAGKGAKKKMKMPVTAVHMCILRSKCAKSSLTATPMKKVLNALKGESHHTKMMAFQGDYVEVQKLLQCINSLGAKTATYAF